MQEKTVFLSLCGHCMERTNNRSDQKKTWIRACEYYFKTNLNKVVFIMQENLCSASDPRTGNEVGAKFI